MWHLLGYQGYEQTGQWLSECGEKLLEDFKHRRTMIYVFKNLLCEEHGLRGIIKTRGGGPSVSEKANWLGETWGQLQMAGPV